MSEQEIGQDTTIPSGETPAPSEAVPQPQTPDVNSTVDINGQQVPITEVVEGYKRADDLAEYRNHASALMNPQNLSQDDREYSMRYVLHAEGYSPSEIENQIESTRQIYTGGGNEDMEDDVDPVQYEQPAPPPVDQNARNQIGALQEQQNKMMVETLKKDLNDSVTKTMRMNPKVSQLIEKSRQLAGEEDLGGRVKGIQAEIQKMALDSMRSRRNRGETFDKSWFDQETNKAADTVYQRIRSVIGDPDKIQRAPETASSIDSFLSKPPVAEPTFEKGDNIGTSQDKAHNYTVDTLSRLAADISAGGKTKA